MTCNCDNDESNEYIIELNQQGAPGVKGDKGDSGYSPIVTYTTDGNGVQINIVNETTTEQTPVLPTKSYTDTQLDNKLNKDGSNATNPISFGNLTITNRFGHVDIDASNNYINLRGEYATLTSTAGDLSINGVYNNSQFAQIRMLHNYGLMLSSNGVNNNIKIETTNGSKAYYNSKELATIDQIPTVGNGTITFTQGGVTKGTFTTNQSGNTTIELDAGGSELTNPLVIINQAEDRTLSLGIDEDDDKVLFNYSIGGVINVPIPLLYGASQPLVLTERSADGLYTLSLNIDSNTLKLDSNNKLTVKEMVGCDSITGGASGLVPAPSAGDQDKFLKADGTWDTVGGGGSSYTEGTGIDITNDTISVDESVVMTTSNQSGINFGAKQFSKITLANGYNTGEGLYGWLDDGSSTIPLVRVSDLDDVIIGDGGSKLVLHGNETRPSYFNGQTTSYLALYSDIPDVSNFVTNSSLATTLADYVDVSTNQTIGGNKTFIGTNYLRNTYICNASGTYFGRMRAVDNKFTFEGIGTNRSINFIPDGTGELQYNGTEVATVNDIPDVSQLQEKLTAGNGINISKGINISLEQTLPYTFNSSYTNTKFVSSSNFDQTKERVVIIEVPISTGYTQFYMSNEGRRGFYIDTNDLSNIWVADGSSYSQSNVTSFPVSGSHNYLKFVIDTDNKFDVYYSYDKTIWTLLLSKDRSDQNTDTWEYGVNIYNEGTTGWTLDYLEASYPLANSELISCDDTIQRKLNATGGIKIEPNGSIRVNSLVALPYTASDSSTDKIFNASDTTVDGTEICGKWDASGVVVFSNDSTALQSGYGFYYANDSITAMARLNSQYNGLATIGGVSYQSDFWYKIKFFADGTIDMYYSTDGITYNLAISTTDAVGGDLYGQDIYVCGQNGSMLSEAYLNIPSTNPVISLDPTTIQGYSSTGTLYLKLVNGVLQWTA